MKEFLTQLRTEARNRILMTTRLCESCGQVSTEAGRHQRAVDRVRYGLDQRRPLG